MSFALGIVGIILLTAGVRGKQDDLFSLLKSDFTGQNNFIFWMISIFVIGALGYIPKLKPLSTAFLALVIVVLFLRKGTGFFAQASQALQGTTTQPTTANTVFTLPDLTKIQPLGGLQ